MRANTFTAMSISIVIGISTLALSAAAPAETITQSTFTNQLGQPVQFIVRNTRINKDRLALKNAISKVLKKHAALSSAEKKKAGCPQADVQINPGSISRALFMVTLRDVRPGVRPKLKVFTTTKTEARWLYHGELERVCVNYQGHGHHSKTWDGWKRNFDLSPKVTTALYVQ